MKKHSHHNVRLDELYKNKPFGAFLNEIEK